MRRADEKEFGNAEKIWNAMKQAVQDIGEGKTSPFAKSDSRETQESVRCCSRMPS